MCCVEKPRLGGRAEGLNIHEIVGKSWIRGIFWISSSQDHDFPCTNLWGCLMPILRPAQMLERLWKNANAGWDDHPALLGTPHRAMADFPAMILRWMCT